jgi:alkylation response protein AidB-like acyl-CoA dehydrogenase
MYDLSLTPEQLEFRDTVRDFVESEVKPAALNPKRLEPFEKPLLAGLLDKAAQMGLRSLALSEEAGGAGADGLTACIVMEELGAGDVDLAAVLAQTATLAHVLFDRLMTPEQRKRFLPEFIRNDDNHLAFAGRDPGAGAGWSYHRPLAENAAEVQAVKQGKEWVVNGTLAFVPNATIAKLFVDVRTDLQTGADGLATLRRAWHAAPLVREPLRAGESIRWHRRAPAWRSDHAPADHVLGEGQRARARSPRKQCAVSRSSRRSISASAARRTKPRWTTPSCAGRAGATSSSTRRSEPSSPTARSGSSSPAT